MLMMAFWGALALVALSRSVKGFALGAIVVLVAYIVQPDDGFAIGFLNNLIDLAVALAAYTVLGLTLLLSAKLQRTMKAFSRS